MKKIHIIFIFLLCFIIVSCTQTKLIKVEFKLVEDASDPDNLVLGEKVLIDNNDIADAVPYDNSIILQMTQDGVQKFKNVTKNNVGRQIAVLLDGKLIMAPIVREPITNGSVMIYLPDTITKKELFTTVAGILNKPVPEYIESENKDIPPKQYYSDEEYSEIKKHRERVGLYYLDRNYSKEELDHLLRKGMEEEDVIRIFGKPSMRFADKGGSGYMHLMYSVADERQPIERGDHPDGFSVAFKENKVFTWSINYSNMTRKAKPQYEEESELKVILPEMDLGGGEADLGKFLESISIPDTRHVLNRRDGIAVVSMIINTPPSETIKGNCDLMLLMENNFPEIAELEWKDKNTKERGKVKLKKLHELLFPYSSGNKKLPGWK